MRAFLLPAVAVLLALPLAPPHWARALQLRPGAPAAAPAHALGPAAHALGPAAHALSPAAHGLANQPAAGPEALPPTAALPPLPASLGDLPASLSSLLALSLQQALYDPILYKTWLAAKMSSAAASGSGCPSEVVCAANSTLVYQGATKAVLTSTSTYQLVVAFTSTDSALSTPIDNSTQFDSIPYADLIVPGNAAAHPQAAAIGAFCTGQDEQQGQSFTSAVQSLNLKTTNATPVNILVTGMENGATLAPLASLYLAVTYPGAHITVITLGGPVWPLNNKANWTLTQLTDLYYFFPASLAGYPELENATLEDIVSLKGGNKGNTKLAEDLLLLLKDAQTVMVIASNGTDLASVDQPPLATVDNTTFVIDLNKTADYGPEQLNATIAAWESVKDQCPPVFCKIRFPSVLQALIYEEYYPATPDVHGPVRIGEVFDEQGTMQLVLEAGRDADGAVGWVPGRETAYFVYRGSESKRDWAADLNAKQEYYQTKSLAQAAVFQDPQVHAGVYRQFERVSVKPLKPEDDFEVVLANISGGVPPRVIVCTGQSLGGGLSSMCGPWAANTWPNASVFVVNEGSLKPGDTHFKDFFNVLVGNAYRLVNGKDQVPLLAPFPDYQHVFRGWWLDNSTTAGPKLFAGEREPLKLKDSNWVDHSYYTYSLLLMEINNLTAPEWVLELQNTSNINYCAFPSSCQSPSSAPASVGAHSFLFSLGLVVLVQLLLGAIL